MPVDDDDFDGDFGLDFAENFLFKKPLYDPIKLTERRRDILFNDENLRLDGYCPGCSERRTFAKQSGSVPHGFQFTSHETYVTYVIKCTRHEHHRLRFYIHVGRADLAKVGQHPSFADIAIDESKQFSKLLTAEDRGEFHKALGLASHGVGIGAFVYLRRIFERLINSRFQEYKEAEGWDEKKFNESRMAEKIDMLKSHLPAFLVENRRIYSIVSLGIHQLSENDCLAFFPILKQSTLFILEEDKQKKERLAEEDAVRKAIASFKPKD
jgi:hypothetical protein